MDEKRAFEEEQAELKRAAEEAAAEAEEEVPVFEPEERDWTLYEYAPFQT